MIAKTRDTTILCHAHISSRHAVANNLLRKNITKEHDFYHIITYRYRKNYTRHYYKSTHSVYLTKKTYSVLLFLVKLDNKRPVYNALDKHNDEDNKTARFSLTSINWIFPRK